MAAQDVGGVERLARRHPGEPPRGARADVAGPLCDHDHVGPQDVHGREQSGVDGDGLVVAAVGLPDGHGAGKPVGGAHRRHRAREGRWQGPAVGHDVDHAGRRLLGAHSGDDRRQGRVEVCHDDRHAAEVLGRRQQVVVRAVLLVHGQEHLLLRGVARLDDVAGPWPRVRRQPVGHRDDEGEPAGAEAAQQRRGVEQDAVAGVGVADDGGVGQRLHGAHARLVTCSSPVSAPVSASAASSRTAYTAAPAHRWSSRSTVPARHCITTGRLATRAPRRRVASVRRHHQTAQQNRRARAHECPRRTRGQDGATPQPRPVPALHPQTADEVPDPRPGPAVRHRRVRRGLRPDVRARQGRAARAGDPARHRGDQLDLGGRDRLPDRPARVRPARDLVRAGRARGARPGEPHVGPRVAGRSRRTGPAQAQGLGHRARQRVAHRHRAAAAHHRAGLRRRQERRAAAPADRVRLPHRGRGRDPPAAGRAVGAGLLARPLVPHRARPRPRGAAGLPPVADHRAGARDRARRTPSTSRPTTGRAT